MSSSKANPKLPLRKALLRSNLIQAAQYDAVVREIGTDEESSVAKALVDHGFLTEYQIQQLQAGRSKLRLGPYLITDYIGQGGMGRVFKGVHDVMGRQCAVKVLPLEKSTTESRQSFQREIRMQAELDSPYLVRAFDAGVDGKVHYLVTEYVPGYDLRRLIKNSGPLSMNDAALIISQAAMGLQYAHELGLVHRDVKPGNILVTPDGQAKVSDIGLASWTMGFDPDPRAGKLVGTADYLSPEQIRDSTQVGPLSDIYSLGCTLYYTVTGKVPFPGGDSLSKCKRHREQTPYHPGRFVPELSEEFVDLIADMMEKDPARRVQTAAEVAERLEPWAAAATEVIEVPQGRQAWTPPPPPSDPSKIREFEFADLPVAEAFSSGLSGEPLSVPQTPEGWESGAVGSRQVMPVAIALAVAIPISLLVGAVIGFLVRGSG
ncbi:serine/threonine protein kinase [Rubripirellula sp.]|jgi:serine/threonine protein kinase|nr:serine/threonine protein kinase [Planctomycetaceae bacterium]MDA9858929.1 serine/threonine protein kinase [Rubripirellula sp.]MDF1840200.1 serine/threonine-protein kinase [Rubripirellula sp.]